MMDIPASPPTFSFPRITRRRRNTNSGAAPTSPQNASASAGVQGPPPPPPHLQPPAPTGGLQSPTSPVFPSPMAPTPVSAHPLPGAPPTDSDRQNYRIRLVPHLESARSLHFEPIIRDVRIGGPPLRVGRFTDRATNPTRGNGLNPNDKNSDKVAFRSKVVSRAHAELWVQGKGVFFLKDTKSSSGTFINHMRLSPPGQESAAHILKDGDVIQLGVDYQGGTEEMYRCVKIKVEVGQGREWQGGANAFNTAALKQLRTLQAVDAGKGKSPAKKTVGDCCICLFAVSVCQSLFIAPCSHAFHYKCIRPLLELHHPGFSCPLCRTFADLDADVEVDETELKAIEDALDEAEEPPSDEAELPGVIPVVNGLTNSKREAAGTAEDAIVIDSDSGGTPQARRTVPNNAETTQNGLYDDANASAVAVHDLGRGPVAAVDEDRQVEEELSADFDEDDDERMVSGSADEFGGRIGDDPMDGTFSPDDRAHHASETSTGGAGPSVSRAIPLRIDSRRSAAESQADREASEFADAATPLNNTFMTMANNLISTVEQYPARGNAGFIPPVPTNPFRAVARNGRGRTSEEPDDEFSTEAEGQDELRRGSSSGSNPATTGNSPGTTTAAAGSTTAGFGLGVGAAARGASGLDAADGTVLAKRKR